MVAGAVTETESLPDKSESISMSECSVENEVRANEVRTIFKVLPSHDVVYVSSMNNLVCADEPKFVRETEVSSQRVRRLHSRLGVLLHSSHQSPSRS